MLKVIVVDDDHSTTALIDMLLRIEGYEAVCCSNSEEALAQVEKGASALIVDYHLGSGDSGLDLVRAIRSHTTESQTDIPIIMVSGDRRVQEGARIQGADAFLLKPYTTAELIGQLKQLLTAQGNEIN